MIMRLGRWPSKISTRVRNCVKSVVIGKGIVLKRPLREV